MQRVKIVSFENRRGYKPRQRGKVPIKVVRGTCQSYRPVG